MTIDEDDANELYCICREPYNPNKDMIRCDYCDEWYHINHDYALM